MKNIVQKSRRILGLVLVFSLLVSLIVPSVVSATDFPKTRVSEIPKDGVYDNWVQDEGTRYGGEVNEVTDDGWLHFSSGSKNGNNPSTTKQPAVFANEDFVMPETGFFEFTYKSSQAPKLNRFGLFLNYDDPGNAFMLGSDATGWFWQRYKAYGGNDYGSGAASAPAVPAGKEAKIRIEWTGKSITSATIDGVSMMSSLPFDFTNIGGEGTKIAFKAGTWGTEITNFYLKDIHYTGQATFTACDVSGKVVDKDNKPIKGANVAVAGATTQFTDADGNFSVTGLIDGSYAAIISSTGFISKTVVFEISGKDVVLEDVSLEKDDVNTTILSTDMMDVEVDLVFPRAIKYTMKNSQKVMDGQISVLENIEINNVSVKPTITSNLVGNNKIKYEMVVKNAAKNIDAVLSAEIVVEKNNLAFNITKIVNNLVNLDYPIETIHIPNHNLVSVRSTDTNPNFKGANISTDTTVSGDVGFDVTATRPASVTRSMYGFISNDQLSAGLWSNSEYSSPGSSGESTNYRVSVYTDKKDGYTSVGLGSSYWYYHRKVTAKGEVEVILQREMPSAKIAIAEDENGDGNISWQDGAITFRTIMNNAQGSESVPELVAHRIAMNFGSQAQNPFLQSLDNVKKVALHTDGLGQSIILKGYGNEGHDSAHPDFFDIGKRIGGADDMVKLLKEGKAYGAKFGIHINTGEMYPEAKSFSEKLVRRDANGVIRYGWNWIDQGVGIDGLYDLIRSERGEELGRKDRLQKLYDLVGNDMDFVYLDIWSNQTSGVEDTWETRRVTNDITSLGWRFVTEFPGASEYDATFHHWATDLGYGSFLTKGHNSSVLRFLRNHQKDSWNADYSHFNGAAVAPLLGGYNMKDFEGWQGRNNYNDYIDNLFRHNVVTKFLQHYEVMQWENGSPVTIGGKAWTPEMKLTLEDNRRENTVVVERGSNDFTNNLSGYRSRNITLNGKQILKGEMAQGNRNSTQSDGRGSETYLIPWIWDSETGDFVSSEAEKLYHWNILGGTTEWDLPAGWENLENVKIYKLTDLGKTEEQVIAVKNGKITIENAVASQPYVVYKGDAEDQLEIKWSVGMHTVDAGFNSGKLDNWTSAGTGSASIARSQFSNPMLKLTGEKSMTQTITDLVPGQKYAVYVGVDNRSDSKASISINANGKVLDSNYTTKSIAKNYIKANAHNTNSSTVGGTSYFQNMYVFFTAPASGDVTITLSKEAGLGDTYFDDIRVVKTAADNITKDNDGNITKFEQNFENNPQGVYPFVIGAIEGVEDNRTHLSELNAPFTQAGWDTKKMDDVLGGNWSLKTNGLVQRSRLVYQTVPQNFRFEAGKTYKLKFEYQMGSEGTYTFVTGDGEFNSSTMSQLSLKKSLGNTATFEYLITGAENGQTWVGIYSTAVEADLQGAVGSGPQNFGGYKDIVLDNLSITATELSSAELTKAISIANKKVELDYSVETWTPFASTLSEALSIMTSEDVTQEKIDTLTTALNTATTNLVLVYTTIKGTVKDGNGSVLVGAKLSLAASNFTTKSSVTDQNGEYIFANIPVRDYRLAVTYEGLYDSSHTFRPVAGKTFIRDVIMVRKGVADYVNNFDDGNVSSLKNFTSNAKQIVVTPTKLNNNDAALIKFPGGRANLYDSASPLFTNGIFEVDVTPQGSSARFGLQMRAIDNDNRVFAGVGDSGGLYFWEYWNQSTNSYSGMFSGVNMVAGTTYKVKMETTATNVRLWVNGSKIFDVAVSNILEKAGYIGFESRLAGSFIIDNISVTSYDKSYVTGHITNNKAESIDNASVKLYNATRSGPVASEMSDANGKYNLGVILAGSYSMRVSKEGYLTASEDISVVGSAVVGAENISLIYAPGLESLMERALGLNQDDYSAEDWGSITEALLAATKVTLLTTDSEIKVITETLARVLDEVVPENKLALKALIDDAAEFVRKDDIYTPDSIEDLKSAIEDAQLVLDDSSATQEQINNALSSLQTAIDNLVENSIEELDTDMLGFMIEYADELVADGALNGVVEKVVTNFNKALAEAKTTLAKANDDPDSVTQDDIDLATENLIEMMHMLDFKGDKAKLQKLVDLSAKYVTDKALYRKATYDIFETALNAAKAVLLDENSLQEDIDKAWLDLASGIAGLRKIPNKDALKELLNKAKSVDSSKFTTASYSLLMDTVKTANAVFEDEEATESEVLSAEIALKKAIDDLKLLSGGGETTTPGGTTTTTPGGTAVPKTGENGFKVFVYFIGSISLLLGFTLTKKKKFLKKN